MYCVHCGKELTGDEKFCSRCGAPTAIDVTGINQTGELIGPSAPETKRKSRKKKIWLILLLLILAAAGVIGCLSWILFRGKGSSGSLTDKERYEIVVQIQEGVNERIAPYLNEESMLDYDETVLTEAAQAVYDYGQELEKDGIISGTALCEEGHSVSFFLEDGSTTVYVPPIQDYYAGSGVSRIDVWDMTTWSDVQAGYDDPGETISGSISSFQKQNYDNSTTIADLQSFLGSLEDGSTRAIFWRGHGAAYTAQNGKIIFAFILNEDVTEETEKLYSQDRQAATDESPCLINVSTGNTYAVNYSFFEKYMSQVDGGLFFSGACKSNADGGIMASTILGKGFDAYVGADDDINQLYSNEVLSETARNLVHLDENNCYTDIETALNQAVETYEGSLGENVNTEILLAGGRFALTQARPFRLIQPYVEVKLTSSDSSVDLDQISIHCLKIQEDGTTETFRRLNGTDLDDGCFSIGDIDFKAEYQLDISYGSYPLKTVVLDNLNERMFENNMTAETIDVRVADLDIIVADENGDFISDAVIQVIASDDENGQIGLTQEPEVTRNSDGESVYRIPLAPGTYTVRVTAEDLGEKKTTVTVEGDRTLRFTSGDALSAYAEVVQQYDEQYGTIAFSDAGYGMTNYSGVFLLELLDFDKDGVEELIIGYSVPHPLGEEECMWPSLDVWRLENGTPVLAYESAVITQSDIGRHCAFTLWNGTYYLMEGMDGYETDITLLSLKNGSFETAYTLQMKEGSSGNGMTYSLNGRETDQESFQETYGEIQAGEKYYYMADYNIGCFNGTIYENSSYTAEDLMNSINEVRRQIGLDEV